MTKKIIRNCYTIFVWYVNFILLIGFSFGSNPIPFKGFIIYLTLFVFLLIVPITYNAVKKTSGYKNWILNYIKIFVCFWLFLSYLNLIYGYGKKSINNKPNIGIFTSLGIPYKYGLLIFLLACILFIVIYICKIQLVFWKDFSKGLSLFITAFFVFEIISIIILNILGIGNMILLLCILLLFLCLIIYYTFNVIFTIKFYKDKNHNWDK